VEAVLRREPAALSIAQPRRVDYTPRAYRLPGTAINDSGEVTGTAELVNGDNHAFLYGNGSMRDIGTLGGSLGGGAGISNSGEITGVSLITSDTALHAFLYSNGQMQDLGTLGGTTSSGAAINDDGQVTGESSTDGAGGQSSFVDGDRAFLYSNGQMIDLNSWVEIGGAALDHDTLVEGVGINDSGQILVDGFLTLNNWSHEDAAFLLTPIPQTNVPEPGTLGLLALGLTGLGGAVAVKGFLDTGLWVMNSVRQPTVGSQRNGRGAAERAI
jgi:probable HAF family extracellular repeat protein